MGVQKAEETGGTQSIGMQAMQGHTLGDEAADPSSEPGGSSGRTRSDSSELPEPQAQDDPAEQERQEMMHMLCHGPEIVVADEGALITLKFCTALTLWSSASLC